MLANAGIVASGAAVMFFASPLPDLIIGLLVGGIVLKGGWNILKEAHDAIGDGSSRPKGQSSPEND